MPSEKVLDIAETGTGESEEKGEEDEEATPEYIFPLFFTSKTQEIFECRIDEDVSAESPHKLISKERILNDYKERAAISDFHPVKSLIQNYPGEELLVVYDPLFKYGQNFFLVTTEEDKETFLNPPEVVVEEDVRPESETLHHVITKPPKPWVSLGSEEEILNENVFQLRPKVKFLIMKKRKEFGAPVFFSDRHSKEDSTDRSGQEDEVHELERKELDKAIQHVPVCEYGFSQTEWPKPRNANVQCVPRTFPTEMQDDIMKSKNVENFLKTVVGRFELALQHNETIDIFTDDYHALADEGSTFGSKSDNHLKEYQSFADLKFSKNKAITHIEWHPTVRGIIAVSCSEQMSFDERIDNSSTVLMNPSFILLWSFADPIHPLLMMEAPDDIMCFQFNSCDPNIIAGGCINGQIVLWDISQYSERITNHRSQAQGQSNKSRTALPHFLNLNKQDLSPIIRYCAVSNIEHSHKMAITDIQWLPDHIEIGRMGSVTENKSMHCNQIISCAADGQVLFWDTRLPKPGSVSQVQTSVSSGISAPFKHLDLTWKPTLKVQVRQLKGSGDLSAMKFSISERQIIRPDKARQDQKLSSDSNEVFDTKGSALSMGLGKKKDEAKVLENVNSKFYVATEEGELVYTDWKLSKDIDTGKVVSPRPELLFDCHDGPITVLERSPFFKDIILTIGGWTFSIWKEGVTLGPLLTSSSHVLRLTSGRWSPSRPGVIFIGKSDGSVDVWDLLDKTHEAFLTQNVTPVTIKTIFPYQVSSKQQLLAIGDRMGTLHIFEVPWNLRQPSTNEVSTVEHYFDREVKRLYYLEERQKKMINEKNEENILTKQEAKVAEDESEWESKARMEYQEYLELERKILEELGIKLEEDDSLETP
eukprot:gene8204-9084_t